MFRTLSPAGSPIPFKAVISSLSALWNKRMVVQGFKEEIENYFGGKHVFLASSGKAALYIILLSLKELSHRDEVIIPAYSSFCLASAVARAGLKARLCDVDPETLDFDLHELLSAISDRTLCVIPVHLFGFVANMESIRELLRFNGSFVVEDAAQAAGALYNGKKAGTLGDVAFFSLGRGKSISTVQGGVVITDNDSIAENITKIIHSIDRGKIGHEICLLAKALGLTVFLHPERYCIPQMVPFLNLGANVYDPGFKIEGFSKIQADLGNRLFCKLDEYNLKRCQNAEFYKVRFNESASFDLPKIPEGSQPIYLRFPIIFQNNDLRESVFNDLTKYRLGANKNFPYPLNEITGFKPFLVNGKKEFPGAKHLTKALLTLPTHPMVERRDLERITEIMSKSL